MDINYGIIAYRLCEDDPNSIAVVHFCGYEKSPTDEDMEALMDELATDEEHGLVDQMDSIALMDAPEHIVKYYRDKYENMDPDLRVRIDRENDGESLA